MASNQVREVMSHQNPALRLGGSAKLDTALPTNVLFLKDSAESPKCANREKCRIQKTPSSSQRRKKIKKDAHFTLQGT